MEKTTISPAFINNANLNNLFEVEELEQRLENSWTESAEVNSDGTGKVRIEHTSESLF